MIDLSPWLGVVIFAIFCAFVLGLTWVRNRHEHRLRAKNVKLNYESWVNDYGITVTTVKNTTVLYVCVACGKSKIKTVKGEWSKEDLAA